jgi:quercetin dioxygenase-like cupin family protein
MLRKQVLAACIAAAAFGTMAAQVASEAAPAATSNVQRRVLLTQDLQIPNYQTVFVEVTIPAGGREGRHTHPGSAVVHVQEGQLTLDMAGAQSKTYMPGETFFIESGKVHEGINNGTSRVRALASFVVEKGKPLASQAE